MIRLSSFRSSQSLRGPRYLVFADEHIVGPLEGHFGGSGGQARDHLCHSQHSTTLPRHPHPPVNPRVRWCHPIPSPHFLIIFRSCHNGAYLVR
jgi:hypothetical protein